MMSSSRDILGSANIVVLKIGSVLIRDADNHVRKDWFLSLAQDVKSLQSAGKKVVIVSSGGVALGRPALGISLDAPPSSIPLEMKQAASSVGQFYMMRAYQEALGALDIEVAQLLITMAETENRRTHLNARHTLQTLMERGIVPVINENDAIASGEIRYGDNDRLAARIAQMIDADVLVLLSTIDGLYSADPHVDKDAEHIPLVDKLVDKYVEMAGDPLPGLSTGGMKSKMLAAQTATQNGIHMIIANGVMDAPIKALLGDEVKSTVLLAQENRKNARKKWISAHVQPRGTLIVDDGAAKALGAGKSLLPVGVEKLEGDFDRGDAVRISRSDGRVLAIGLSSYDSDDAALIIGKPSSEIAGILGYLRSDVLVHRNDMVLHDS